VAKRRLTPPVGRRGRASADYNRRIDVLLSQRDALMNEITVIRSLGRAPSPLINKADALLTRFWAKATWHAREEILRSARWLLTMGSFQSAVRATKMKPAKRKRALRVPASAEAI
jgi:hypothetical protein